MQTIEPFIDGRYAVYISALASIKQAMSWGGQVTHGFLDGLHDTDRIYVACPGASVDDVIDALPPRVDRMATYIVDLEALAAAFNHDGVALCAYLDDIEDSLLTPELFRRIGPPFPDPDRRSTGTQDPPCMMPTIPSMADRFDEALICGTDTDHLFITLMLGPPPAGCRWKPLAHLGVMNWRDRLPLVPFLRTCDHVTFLPDQRVMDYAFNPEYPERTERFYPLREDLENAPFGDLRPLTCGIMLPGGRLPVPIQYKLLRAARRRRAAAALMPHRLVASLLTRAFAPLGQRALSDPTRRRR